MHRQQLKLAPLAEPIQDTWVEAAGRMQKEVYAAAWDPTGLPWTAAEAHLVLESPGQKPMCFYMDVCTGECFRVDKDTDVLSDADIHQNWELVEAADLLEISSFVEQKVFKSTYIKDVTSSIIDAIWIRKWKRMPDGTLKIKSRLCARGFLDPQKHFLPTASSTATRLSHKIVMSLCVLLDLKLESWDISAAFLKGFTFKEMERVFREKGLGIPKRRVYLKPPNNVWRLLRKIPNSKATSVTCLQVGCAWNCLSACTASTMHHPPGTRN